jgi:hypothetical protein
MQDWANFYELLGGTAATLLGLLFVSVSLNAETILGPNHLHSRRLAEQAFQNYLCVIMIALMVFFPGSGAVGLGYSVFWTTGIWGIWVLARIWQISTGTVDRMARFRMLRRYAATLLGFVLLLYSGAQMARRAGDYTVEIGIGVLLLLISATIVSWELLIRVAAEKYASHRD